MRATLVPLLLAAACGASSPSTAPAPPTAETSCADLQREAAEPLSVIAKANMACTQDSDCITVAFGASCFDQCTRSIAGTGKAAFEAAIRDANAGACATYAQQSCPPHEVPPCAPPSAPMCREGTCI